MEVEFERQLAELKHLQESSLAIWSMYVTWFTWFVSISVTILGWFATHDSQAQAQVSDRFLQPLCLFMIAANSFGLILAAAIFNYDLKARRRAIELALSPEAAKISRTVAKQVSQFSALLIVGALGGLIILWAYVGFWMPGA